LADIGYWLIFGYWILYILLAVLMLLICDVIPRKVRLAAIAFEQKERDYLLWGCFRWSFAAVRAHLLVAYCN
jgi:hypothetical protein